MRTYANYVCSPSGKCGKGKPLHPIGVADMKGASPLQTTQTTLSRGGARGPFFRLRPLLMRAAEKRAGRMASFHCQVKAISRSDGRSATAAAAYRAGERIACDREGRVHDYTRKQGIEASFIHAPADAPDWVQDRASLWNRAEESENRKNARVAREWEIALPAELSADQRRELASDYALALVDRYGAAVDVSIHAPHRDGDKRNYHAHVMVTTRKIGRDGFGEKTRVLDDRKTGPREIETTREMWADMQNDRLERAGIGARVDHRSLKEQRAEALARGDHRAAQLLDRPPEAHMGPQVSGMERREQREAEAEGRPYEPLTERGKAVHEIREAKSLLERLTARLEAVRERLLGRSDSSAAKGQKEAESRQPAPQSLLTRIKNKFGRNEGARELDKDAQKKAQERVEKPKGPTLFDKQPRSEAGKKQNQKDRAAEEVAEKAGERLKEVEKEFVENEWDKRIAGWHNNAGRSKKTKRLKEKQRSQEQHAPVRDQNKAKATPAQPKAPNSEKSPMNTRVVQHKNVGPEKNTQERVDSTRHVHTKNDEPNRQAAAKPKDKEQEAARERIKQSREARERPRAKPKDRSNDWER